MEWNWTGMWNGMIIRTYIKTCLIDQLHDKSLQCTALFPPPLKFPAASMCKVRMYVRTYVCMYVHIATQVTTHTYCSTIINILI